MSQLQKGGNNEFKESSNISALQKHKCWHFFLPETREDLPFYKGKQKLGPESVDFPVSCVFCQIDHEV